MSKWIESGLYVALDGSWGDAQGMSIIDDRDWEQADYNLLDEASDSNKADLADKIDAWVKLGRPKGDFNTWSENLCGFCNKAEAYDNDLCKSCYEDGVEEVFTDE